GPWGRGTPRWSSVGASFGSPASIAGLPCVSAWVQVGPPLSCSGPSSGSTPTRSVLLYPASGQPLVLRTRLCPRDSRLPPMSSGVIGWPLPDRLLPAIIEFLL